MKKEKEKVHGMKQIEIKLEQGESLIDAMKRMVFQSNEQDSELLFETVRDILNYHE